MRLSARNHCITTCFGQWNRNRSSSSMENTGAAKRSDEPTVSAPSFGSFPQPALGSNPKQQSVQSRRPKASRTDAGKRKDVRGSRQHTEGEIRFSRIGEQRTHDHMAGQVCAPVVPTDFRTFTPIELETRMLFTTAPMHRSPPLDSGAMGVRYFKNCR